ncbi:glycosyltransferase family 2 protein [Xanthomarina gelatinilytica]|uniref:glycosyltransferase family 2 protein n=1 Tax=Xanthomarina gelatinilytica TaxID=1137281 RepID=UPI003AA986F7
MSSKLISIIIPTYNRAHVIGETLDSILAQTYTHWECIVVDDGSTDGTEDLMAEYMERDTRFRYYHRPAERPKGPCSCRNYGFEHSKGVYVNFFDSDDLLKPEAFEKALNGFKQDTDAVIINSALIDFNTKTLHSRNRIYSENLLTDYFIGEITFLVCGPLWRRNFLMQQNYLFDENIGNVDDWDFNLRMLYANPNLIFMDDVLIYYRMHPNSFSMEVRKLNKKEIISDFKARDKHLKIISDRKDVDLKKIKTFILYRYKRYFKWALTQKANNDILSLLIKKLIKTQIHFKDYFGAFKSSFGYMVVKFTGKGYVFFKD